MSKQIIELSIDVKGNVRAIYQDEALEIYDAIGDRTVNRASKVEPEGDQWTVDLRPIGGPFLFQRFKERQEALAAEEKWIRANRL